MSTEEPLNIMAEEEYLDQGKLIEIYYSKNMSCPVGDCDVVGIFTTKAKYTRHWEERHLLIVKKLECPIQYCCSHLRRKSDLKSHLKHMHGEKDDTRIEDFIVKSKKVVKNSHNFINPGFFTFKGRTLDSVQSSTPAISPAEVPISSSVVQASAAIVPSPMVISNDFTSTDDQHNDTQINVPIPASLPVSTSESSTQTSGMDVMEVYLPPIPGTLVDVQDYIRKLCDIMDKVARLRVAAKSRYDFLMKEEPSLQREKERRQKLESENRELKRQLEEIRWRDNLFPGMEY